MNDPQPPPGMELCPGCQKRLINTRYAEKLCAPCQEAKDTPPPPRPMRPARRRLGIYRVIRLDKEGGEIRITRAATNEEAAIEATKAEDEGFDFHSYRTETIRRANNA